MGRTKVGETTAALDHARLPAAEVRDPAQLARTGMMAAGFGWDLVQAVVVVDWPC